MTAKHRRFVAEYLIDPNGTKAYRRVYPDCRSDAAAATNAGKLLKNTEIRRAVAAGQKRLADRLEMTADQVLVELSTVARAPVKGKVSTKDKVTALTVLAKRHGLIRERHSVENPDGTPLNLAALTAAQLEQLEALLALTAPPAKG